MRNCSSYSLGVLTQSRNTQTLQFDRVIGDPSLPPSILYADILSPTFSQFHKTLIKTALQGKTSYRVRYRPSTSLPPRPLLINGYGVELALKKTDYIVIDDRDADKDIVDEAEPAETVFDEEELADLKPLSASELRDLNVKASSFVMGSSDPFDTLIRISRDFPKYSSAITSHNASAEFLKEHGDNRVHMMPLGMNIMWINGVQMDPRHIDPFSLLEHLRREKKLINGFRSLGLSGLEAIKLLSHQTILEANAEDEPQRYDWRDDDEGGKVIVWMNDIEKDKRYIEWPDQLKSV
jgi:UDP-glucose:glycoprotein glucosyltransferase